MKLSDYTVKLLADIESRIDPEVEDDYYGEWVKFWDNKVDDVIFRPRRKKRSAPGIDIKNININDAVKDYETMLCMQLGYVSGALKNGVGALCMRSNYGTGIMTSLFGADIFEMPYETNTLPTTKSFNDTEIIRDIVDKGMPALDNGFGRQVFEFGQMCLEVFKDYPKISKYVTMYHPDTQGPLDVCELLWGGEMFYALYDEPELVHGLMQLITDTYVKLMERWYELYPDKGDLSVHWGMFMRGALCLRNDSAINLSPDQYTEFALKYDKYLLDRFGGGMVHYCGKGDHFIGQLTALDNVYGINLSQPELNDMEKIYRLANEHKVKLLGLSHGACAEYERRADAVRGMISNNP